MPENEKRIIIDEGWKAQVQREKEQAARQQAEQPVPASTAAAPEQAPRPPDATEMEEASFSMLLSSLATQAMLALGLIVPQGAREIPIHLDQAKYIIDTLSMLDEKTKGNLTKEEDAQLKDTRAELQQVYVARVRQLEEQALQQSGIDPRNLKGGPKQ